MNIPVLNKNEFYAIKISQPYGDFYSVVIQSDILLKLCHSREAEYRDGFISGAQRKQSESQKKDIAKFIESEQACFPNNIILSANYDEQDNLLEYDYQWKFEHIQGDLYKIFIPDLNIKSCSIIDGQHRLKAFELTKTSPMAISCSIFDALEPHAQAEIFATINFNQRKVDKSLAYQLFGVSLEHTNRSSWSPDMLAVYFCRKFSKSGGVLHRRINYRIKNQDVDRSWNFSTSSFVDGLVKLISKRPKLDRYTIYDRTLSGSPSRQRLQNEVDCPLRPMYQEENDLAIEQILTAYFEAVNKHIWSKVKDKSDNVLVSNIGLLSLFEVLGKVLLSNEINRDLLERFDTVFSNVDYEEFKNKELYPASTKGKTAMVAELLKQIDM
ncbi:DGQHR domain-containing protein [Vibrio panuliri]|nr:DGQHR domain-containing protein [Vibrio panuliri]KAB1454811.1 DGQHR domain-containing protein [Vibrio panuliri]